jgi:hypothetical protein
MSYYELLGRFVVFLLALGGAIALLMFVLFVALSLADALDSKYGKPWGAVGYFGAFVAPTAAFLLGQLAERYGWLG